ncbi:MAG: hypothetical protein ACKOED_12425 [Aestuariivirga sp.]|uniref:hypothetical protein n=1 Tax=Aestuariivirga sp. TaxID=2650926 RepID=UPI0038CF954C
MPLMPVEDALRRILHGVKPLAAEAVPLAESLGRVLAKPLAAKRDQPPFAASAMDGYAVIAADVATAPARLQVVGVAAAGHGFKGRLRPGQCVRIFSGAPLPRGADTVVIQENAKPLDCGRVEILQAARQGQNVRVKGLDFRRGEALLPKGFRLNARDIGLAADGLTIFLK